MRSDQRVFIFLYAASGAAALMYEVAWTRLLTLQMGHTVAAASAVLAAFMGGLAAGAAIAGRVHVRAAERLRAYAGLELIVAASAIALPVALALSVPALRWAYANGDAPLRFGVMRLGIALTLLGIPAAAMGATFPLAASWFAALRVDPARPAPDNAGDAADAGALYAANTA